MRHGFTLIELAIVLVVIGLLVGGTLVGVRLVAQSTLRSAISEIEKLKTAVDSFNQMHQGYPGDLPNASDLWPTCDATPANCNGDGDGRIDHAERFRSLQQLSAARLTDQSFAGTGNNPVTLGTDTLNSPIDGAGIMLVFVEATNYASAWWDATSERNAILLGGSAVSTTAPAIRADDAMMMDEKIDDGLPGQGRFRASDINNANCVTTNVAATSAYALANSDARGCAINVSLE